MKTKRILSLLVLITLATLCRGAGAWMYQANATGFTINGGTTSNSILTISSAGTITINGSGTISLPLLGGGNVTGPASSTNFAIARYNGTGGTTLSNSSVTIDNSGNFATNGTATASGLIFSNTEVKAPVLTSTGTVTGASANFGNLVATSSISTSTVFTSYLFADYIIATNTSTFSDTNFNTNVITMPNVDTAGAVNFTGFDSNNNVVLLTVANAASLLGVSDQRVKKNIVPFTGGASIVNAINPIRFNFTGTGVDGKPDGRDPAVVHLSVRAQDVQKVLPEAVSTLPNGTLSVDDRALLMAALNNLKELNAQIAVLTASLSHP